MHQMHFHARELLLDFALKLVDRAAQIRDIDKHIHSEKIIHYYLRDLYDTSVSLRHSSSDSGKDTDLIFADYSQHSVFFFIHYVVLLGFD